MATETSILGPSDYAKFLTAPSSNVAANKAASSPFDYSAIRQASSEAVANTRDVAGISHGYQGLTEMYKQAKHYGKGAEARAVMGKAQGDIKSLQSQADKAATGLEMMGAGMENYLAKLQEVQDFTNTAYQSAAANWDASAEKADEYVQASRDRVGETLAKLDEIHEQIGRDRDFSRAHALQAGAQAVLGSMKTEERNILQQYGAESKEYDQFHKGKMVALATMQSNIHANYQQFQEQAGQQYLMASNEAMWKQNMYTSFQEQQHVEMLKYVESTKYEYAMNKAQFDVTLEQLQLNGMGDWANWIVGTPNFTYDAVPMMTLLADIKQSAINQTAANDSLMDPKAVAFQRNLSVGQAGGGGRVSYAPQTTRA